MDRQKKLQIQTLKTGCSTMVRSMFLPPQISRVQLYLVKPWKVRCHTKTYYLNSFISLLSRNVFPNYLDAVDMFFKQ